LSRAVFFVVLLGIASGTAGTPTPPSACEPDGNPAEGFVSSLADLRRSLQELIDHRDAVSLADRSHKLLIRVEESLLREIACP
jgi:hypothetical protein